EASTLSLVTLTKHTGRALELFTDVLLHPAFPAKELERVRTERLAMLKARLDNPESVAGGVFPRLLYSLEHPYGRPAVGPPRSIEGLTRDDIAAFQKRISLPNKGSLIVAGDTTPAAITAALEQTLKDWKPGAPPRATLPDPAPAKPVTVYLIDK